MKIAALLMLVTFLVSCADEEVLYTYDEDSFVLYMTNGETEGLMPIYIDYEPEKNDDTIIYIVEYLTNGLSDEIKGSIPKEVELEKVELYSEGVILYFNEAYSELDSVDELVVRSSLVKTLTGIEGIEQIMIYSDSHPIVDDDGEIIGSIYADGIRVSSNNVEIYGKKINTFYFADDSGENLKPVEYEFDIYNSICIEESIVNILMEGIEEEGYKTLIPKGSEIRSIYTYGSVCYIDFNRAFVTNNSGNVTAGKLTIYSIVNTLTELPDVTKVKFFIEGKSVKTYKGNAGFDELYKRNLNIVEY